MVKQKHETLNPNILLATMILVLLALLGMCVHLDKREFTIPTQETIGDTNECCMIDKECFIISTLECSKLKDLFLKPKQIDENSKKLLEITNEVKDITIKLKNMPRYDTVVEGNVVSTAIILGLCFVFFVLSMCNTQDVIKLNYRELCDKKIPSTMTSIVNRVIELQEKEKNHYIKEKEKEEKVKEEKNIS